MTPSPTTIKISFWRPGRPFTVKPRSEPSEFMESFDLQRWTRLGTMNLVAPVFQPARRADWKVGVTAARFMGSLQDFKIAHRGHEPAMAPLTAAPSPRRTRGEGGRRQGERWWFMESPGYRVVWASLCLLLLGTCFGVQAQAPNSAARPGTNAPAKLDYSAFKIISERNIFNPNRSARSAREGGRPQKQAKAADSFSLVGTLSYDKGCFAFFEGTSSQYKKVLKKGGDIAGYTVKEIAHDYVRLESAGKQTEMRVGTRMRKEDEGGWRLLGQSELLASGSQSTNSVENAESASDDESNDVLRKLMQNREEELNK